MNYFCVLTLYDDSTKTKSLSMGCVLMYSKYDLLNDNKSLIIFFGIILWIALNQTLCILFYVQYFNYSYYE